MMDPFNLQGSQQRVFFYVRDATELLNTMFADDANCHPSFFSTVIRDNLVSRMP